MEPPIQEERHRRFSQMDKSKMKFAGEEKDVLAAFGMV